MPAVRVKLVGLKVHDLARWLPFPKPARISPTCGAPIGAGGDQSERTLATIISADLVGSIGRLPRRET
jgi:hypothetical protein